MKPTSGDATIEREITDQVVALRARLHSTVKKRREIEGRIRKLRSKLRAEEARLESEEEREEALKTALKMAELALNLASGETTADNLSSLETLDQGTDWEDMTIAQACQRVLQENHNRAMSNRELQAALQSKGKDVPLGSIPTTLERYREQFRKEKRGHVIYWSLYADEPQPIESEN
ncbi:MAG: hypothetical protein ABEK03_10590 [Candidatus Bipolaricaulia bacterium]